jgi:predicted transposase/invertase (TIGR01784 family)
MKDFRFSFIELPKFNKKEEDLLSIEDKWIYFLKNAKNLKVIPKNIVESEIKEAFKMLDKFDWSKEELDIYDKASIYRQDERGRIEQAWLEGKTEGKIEGKSEC